MASLVVLVNGLPGAGKTTLASALSGELDATLLSKDVAKRALADQVDATTQAHLGAVAMEVIWALTRVLNDVVVVDSWWYGPRDRGHVARALEYVQPRYAVEVWCEVPVSVARERYAQRRRSALFDDRDRLARDWDRWAADGAPLGLTPCIRASTAERVDPAGLAMTISEVCGITDAHIGSQPELGIKIAAGNRATR